MPGVTKATSPGEVLAGSGSRSPNPASLSVMARGLVGDASVANSPLSGARDGLKAIVVVVFVRVVLCESHRIAPGNKWNSRELLFKGSKKNKTLEETKSRRRP